MNRWIVVPLLALLAVILHTQLYLSNFGARLEPQLLDLWFNVRGDQEPPGNVVLVAMDEQSYVQLGIPFNVAWPRELHAQLITRLKELGAQRVIFDVLFLGPGSDPQGDAELARAAASMPTILGADSGGREMGTAGGSFQIEELLLPHEPLLKAASGVALVSLPEDDGHLRRFQVARSQLTKELPTLAEAAAAMEPRAGGPGPRDFIWYYGRPGTIPTISYYQVLDREYPIPLQRLKGKTVFVGLALRTELGPAQKDTYLTPFYERGSMFGVEIHATVAENLITKTWVKRSSVWLETIVLGILAFGISMILFVLRPQWAGVVFALTLAVWLVCSYVFFFQGFFLPGATLCGIVLPLAYFGSTLYYYIITRRSQQKIETAFEHYLSRDMAREMAKNPKLLSLGGEKLWATALFTDIEHFTDITEEMPAEQVAAMLNSYFSEVVDVVFLHQGTLIKFIGDAIFALWGAPVKINNHAEKAVQAALALKKTIGRFNDSKRFPTLTTRIGLHTGPMVVGNLGGAKRFDYTAIGDSVNLAARMEGANKFFGTTILLTGTVKKEIGNLFPTVLLGEVRVAGKREPITAYTVLDDSLSPELSSRWDNAIRSFSECRWDEAEQSFSEIAKRVDALVGAANLYLSLIKDYRLTPPPRDWRGELQFEKK